MEIGDSMDMIKSKLKSMYRTSMIFSIILFFIGLFLVIKASTTLHAISYIIGVMLILWGVVQIITALTNKEKENNYLSAGFILGVFSLIIGIVVIIDPEIIGSIIPFVIGIWMVINGVTKLYYALSLNKIQKATPAVIISLIILACGIFLIANPFKGAEILTQIIGASIMVYSVLDIVECFTLKKVVKDFTKEPTKNDVKVIEAQYEETK